MAKGSNFLTLSLTTVGQSLNQRDFFLPQDDDIRTSGCHNNIVLVSWRTDFHCPRDSEGQHTASHPLTGQAKHHTHQLLKDTVMMPSEPALVERGQTNIDKLDRCYKYGELQILKGTRRPFVPETNSGNYMHCDTTSTRHL